MRDHEIELISALVEGRLEDETEARALLDSSPGLQAEYEAQSLAYEALTSAGPAKLGEDEKTALHRDVWTALRSEQTSSPSRAPWLFRWVPVVGVGIFVVGIGTLTLLNQGTSGDTAALFDGETDVTTIASTNTTEAAMAEANDGDEATDLTLAGATAEAPAIESFSAAARALRHPDADTTEELATENAAKSKQDACLETAGLAGSKIVFSVDQAVFIDSSTGEELEGSFIAAIPAGADLETAPISFVDLDTCEIAYVDG